MIISASLPDDILVVILSFLPYTDAVRTASVSRRWEWERLLTHLPNLVFYMSTSKREPSEPRLRSIERTLRRRCRDANGGAAVQELELAYRKDVPMECRYADDFIALANARKLVLHIHCARVLSDEDVGAWSLELPPAMAELELVPFWYAVRPPHIHGPSVINLRSLELAGVTVLRQDFLLTKLPSLEDLAIGLCTIDASIEITSDSMPRLKHLEITDVSVMTKHVKAVISVRAGELRTLLRMSCRESSKMHSPSDPDWFRLPSRFSASFTVYSAFHLHAPKLQVFDWRCCYADEVRVDAVGRLSDVTVEIAAGRMPRTYKEEHSFFSVERRDKLMTDILQGLMPGLRAPSWDYIKRKCVPRGDMWLCFEIASSSRYPVTE